MVSLVTKLGFVGVGEKRNSMHSQYPKYINYNASSYIILSSFSIFSIFVKSMTFLLNLPNFKSLRAWKITFFDGFYTRLYLHH